MLMAGGIAALAAAGGGLAVLVTLTLIGWITAPHVGLGGGLAGVLRSAGLLWLVAHHVEVTVGGVGRIGLLPLGLVLLPAALIERAGRWMTHEGHVKRLRDVGLAALAIAFPYALFTGAVAVASRTALAAPSLWQAVMMGFLIALLPLVHTTGVIPAAMMLTCLAVSALMPVGGRLSKPYMLACVTLVAVTLCAPDALAPAPDQV